MEQYLNRSTNYCSENIVDLISYTTSWTETAQDLDGGDFESVD